MLDPLRSKDLMARVFTHLTPQQALGAGQTCKAWNAASRDASLWRAQMDQVFETPPPPSSLDARAAFVDRWQASRVATTALQKPQTRTLQTNQLAHDPATLARPHRLELSHYILDRVGCALAARLDRSALKSGVARALACAHACDKSAVAALGESLKEAFAKRELPTGVSRG